jgi:chaperone required for assembly of F1-ATPase
MKRFFDVAAPTSGADGFGVALDGRPVRTPAGRALTVPSEALALSMAAEWAAQGDKVDFATMPMNGLANAAIDRIAMDRDGFARGLASYAQGDCLAYRAAEPPSLAARQNDVWDPILDWARLRYDIVIRTTTGIVHCPQPDETVARLAAEVAALDPFRLAGLSPLVTVSGSLIVALAVADGALDAESGFRAGQLDELWQVEQWGEDDLALRTRAAHQADFKAGARFLSLL